MRIGCASLISIVEAAAVWLDTVSLPQEPAALSELLPAGKSALVMSIMGIPGYEKTSRKARSSATSPPSSSMPLARPGALRRSIEDLEIVAAHLAVRMNDLHQPGDRLRTAFRSRAFRCTPSGIRVERQWRSSTATHAPRR
jgi:hypothetical protein